MYGSPTSDLRERDTDIHDLGFVGLCPSSRLVISANGSQNSEHRLPTHDCGWIGKQIVNRES